MLVTKDQPAGMANQEIKAQPDRKVVVCNPFAPFMLLQENWPAKHLAQTDLQESRARRVPRVDPVNQGATGKEVRFPQLIANRVE